MPEQPEDRRAALAGAAIEVVASRGLRALTHRALDAELGLPAGSASYYLRTRQALLAAVVHELAARARADFASSGLALPDDAGPPDPERVADAVAGHLDRTVARRERELRTRYALLPELGRDADLRPLLLVGVFSPDLAEALCAALGAPDPGPAADGLLALLDGLLLDRVAGRGLVAGPRAGTAASRRALRAALAPYLHGLAAPPTTPASGARLPE